MKKLWLYYLIPLGIHLLFLPFWFLDGIASDVSLLEMIVGTLFIPIYLLIISAKDSKRVSSNRFTFLLLKMLLITIAGQLIELFNYWAAKGFTRFDSETILITKWLMTISGITIFFGWTIICFAKNLFNDPEDS